MEIELIFKTNIQGEIFLQKQFFLIQENDKSFYLLFFHIAG